MDDKGATINTSAATKVITTSGAAKQVATPSTTASSTNTNSTVGAVATAIPAEATPPSGPLLSPRSLLQLSDVLSTQAQAAETGDPKRENMSVNSYHDQQNTTDLEEQEEMPLVWPVMASGEVAESDADEPAGRRTYALSFVTGALAASLGTMMVWALYTIVASGPPRRRGDDRTRSTAEMVERQRRRARNDARSPAAEAGHSGPLHRFSSAWNGAVIGSARALSVWWRAALGRVSSSSFAVRAWIGNAILPADMQPSAPPLRTRSMAESISRKAAPPYRSEAPNRGSYREQAAAENLLLAARLARGNGANTNSPGPRRLGSVNPRQAFDAQEDPLRLPPWMNVKRPQSSRV